MKRLFLILLGCLMLFLSGCSFDGTNTTDSNTIEASTTTKEDPVVTFNNYEGYVSTLEIIQEKLPNAIQWPGLSFLASYQHVTYSAVSRVVCVTAFLTDSNYRGATYYLVGRYVGATLEETRYIFQSSSSSTSYSACFNGLDLSQSYEILLAKNDTDVPEAHASLYSVVTLTLHDPQAHLRGAVFSTDDLDEMPDYLEMNEVSTIPYSPRFVDADRTVTSMTFTLVTKENRSFVESKTIPVTEAMYDGDDLQFPTMIFENVAPGYAYFIMSTMSGNDGIDDFKDVPALRYEVLTPTYRDIEVISIRHDLYAVITGLEVIADQVVFHYIIVNTTGSEHAIRAEIYYSDLHGASFEQFISLSPSEHTFSISAALLRFGAQILIRDTTTNNAFIRRVIDTNFNYYYIYYQYGLQGRITVEIREEDYTETISCYLEIYRADGTLLETVNLQSYEPGITYDLTISTRYQNVPGVWGKVFYRVDSEIGYVNHEVIVYLIQW
jgi:hypothetical protein